MRAQGATEPDEPPSAGPLDLDETVPPRPLAELLRADPLSESPAAAGKTLGPYQLTRELGRGGMGVVYEASDAQGRRVALKVLLAGKEASEVQRKRFLREGSVTRRLEHPGIASVLDQGEVEGLCYLALEFVEGRELRLALPELSVDELVAVLAKAARAVGHAHERSILHRDLKPANILLRRDGEPVVTDFGLARELDRSSSLTRSGQALGTPYYMAPEQLAAKEALPQTDVYALGVVLYEGLTGQTPFAKCETAAQLFAAIASETPTPPGELSRGTPPALDAIFARTAAKEPSQRYADANALAADLEAYLRGEAPAAPLVARGRGVAGLALGGLALGALALGGLALGGVALGTLALGEPRSGPSAREGGPGLAQASASPLAPEATRGASASAEGTPASAASVAEETPRATGAGAGPGPSPGPGPGAGPGAGPRSPDRASPSPAGQLGPAPASSEARGPLVLDPGPPADRSRLTMWCESWLSKVARLRRARSYERALRITEALAREAPGYGRVHAVRAETLARLQRVPEALEAALAAMTAAKPSRHASLQTFVLRLLADRELLLAHERLRASEGKAATAEAVIELIRAEVRGAPGARAAFLARAQASLREADPDWRLALTLAGREAPRSWAKAEPLFADALRRSLLPGDFNSPRPALEFARALQAEGQDARAREVARAGLEGTSAGHPLYGDLEALARALEPRPGR